MSKTMDQQDVASVPEARKCCRKRNRVSYFLSMGAGLGIVLGGAFESPGLCLALGAGFGMAVGMVLDSRDSA